MIRFGWRVFLVSAALAAASGAAAAQTRDAQAAVPDSLTLEQAIQYAGDHYPAIRGALERINASQAGVDVARSAYLPRLDALWQTNRATANNIFGQVLPQSVIPAMSGPVLTSASSQSVWGSATGALLSWEPVDFGLRRATIAGAEAAVTQARADEALTRLDVQRAVGVAFLDVLAADRAVAAARADVDRREALARSVHVLVDNQLRPGADASRADAERAAAQTRLIQAQQTLTIAQTILRRTLGVSSGSVTIDGASVINRLPPAETSAAPPPLPVLSGHPLARVRQAAVDVARAQEDVLARSDYPRVYLQSSVFARGSGANASGVLDGGADGLGLDRANWAAGLQLVFPNLFDFASLHARKSAASASERAEAARYDETLLTIASEQAAAAAIVQAARAIAANTPIQLSAAQQSEAQARARYQAGLANLVEIADAQSLLAQAEVQEQLARVDVWRALLAEAVALGDLAPFLRIVRQ